MQQLGNSFVPEKSKIHERESTKVNAPARISKSNFGGLNVYYIFEAMEKIDIKIDKAGGLGIFHNSRNDVKVLAGVCNTLIDKVNELIDENEKLKELVNQKRFHTSYNP